MSVYEKHLFICENQRPEGDPRGCCSSKGAAELTSTLKKRVADAGLAKKVRVNKAGCLGQCAFGVVAVLYPQGVWLKNLSVSDADMIFDKYLRDHD
jgi:(2Fe-2S) ferredoxin